MRTSLKNKTCFCSPKYDLSCEFKREVNSRLSADKRLIVSSGADEGGRRLISKAQSIQDTYFQFHQLRQIRCMDFD